MGLETTRRVDRETNEPRDILPTAEDATF